MIKFISQFIDLLLQNAEKLGQLSVTAVWGFVVLVLLTYIIWKMRLEKESAENAWNARLKEAEADTMLAHALEKIADQVKELRFKLRCIGGSDDKAA